MISLLSFASSPVLQCRSSSRAGLQGWLAQTCHKLSGCQALAFSVQACCCPLGRSRMERVRMEAADPSRLESDGLDGGTAFVRHLYKSGVNFDQINSTELMDCVILRFWIISCSLLQPRPLRQDFTRSVLLVKKGQSLSITL